MDLNGTHCAQIRRAFPLRISYLPTSNGKHLVCLCTFCMVRLAVLTNIFAHTLFVWSVLLQVNTQLKMDHLLKIVKKNQKFDYRSEIFYTSRVVYHVSCLNMTVSLVLAMIG